MDYALAEATERMIGQLCTTWEPANVVLPAMLDPDAGTTDQARKTVATLRMCLKRLTSVDYQQQYAKQVATPQP